MEEVFMTQEEMNASIEVGDIIETDRGEKLRCVSKENGEPLFEAVTKITMDFGGAIKALKEGHKVARKGWNGKGMFLWLKPATEVKAECAKTLFSNLLRMIMEAVFTHLAQSVCLPMIVQVERLY